MKNKDVRIVRGIPLQSNHPQAKDLLRRNLQGESIP